MKNLFKKISLVLLALLLLLPINSCNKEEEALSKETIEVKPQCVSCIVVALVAYAVISTGYIAAHIQKPTPLQMGEHELFEIDNNGEVVHNPNTPTIQFINDLTSTSFIEFQRNNQISPNLYFRINRNGNDRLTRSFRLIMKIINVDGGIPIYINHIIDINLALYNSSNDIIACVPLFDAVNNGSNDESQFLQMFHTGLNVDQRFRIDANITNTRVSDNANDFIIGGARRFTTDFDFFNHRRILSNDTKKHNITVSDRVSVDGNNNIYYKFTNTHPASKKLGVQSFITIYFTEKGSDNKKIGYAKTYKRTSLATGVQKFSASIMASFVKNNKTWEAYKYRTGVLEVSSSKHDGSINDFMNITNFKPNK